MKQKESILEFHRDQSLTHGDENSNSMPLSEIIIGTFSGLDNKGNPLVDFALNGSTEPVVAISTVALNQQYIGRQVALLFDRGNPEKPVVIGIIHNPLQELIDNFESSSVENSISEENPYEMDIKDDNSADNLINDIYLDGERLVLEGKKEIVLKCGDSSITLTKAGKILIRGKYLLNRSAGVNRILGGSVQIN